MSRLTTASTSSPVSPRSTTTSSISYAPDPSIGLRGCKYLSPSFSAPSVVSSRRCSWTTRRSRSRRWTRGTTTFGYIKKRINPSPATLPGPPSARTSIRPGLPGRSETPPHRRRTLSSAVPGTIRKALGRVTVQNGIPLERPASKRPNATCPIFRGARRGSCDPTWPGGPT